MVFIHSVEQTGGALHLAAAHFLHVDFPEFQPITSWILREL
jgi:hypothetical protein